MSQNTHTQFDSDLLNLIFFLFRCTCVRNAVTQQTSQKCIICIWKQIIHIHRLCWSSTTNVILNSQIQHSPTIYWGANCRCRSTTKHKQLDSTANGQLITKQFCKKESLDIQFFIHFFVNLFLYSSKFYKIYYISILHWKAAHFCSNWRNKKKQTKFGLRNSTNILAQW